MPTYDYVCNTCGETFACDRRMADPPLTTRPGCLAGSCQITKVVSRFYSMVATPAARAPATELPPPAPAAEAGEAHVCSKYCPLHK